MGQINFKYASETSVEYAHEKQPKKIAFHNSKSLLKHIGLTGVIYGNSKSLFKILKEAQQ